jgi:uncharacterized protein YcbK (DUF882 family)
LDRRKFLKLSAAGVACLAAPNVFAASSSLSELPERTLSFYNLHTDEKLKTVYWANGEYVSSSLSEIHQILRDFRTGEKLPIDRNLLDLLCEVHLKMESKSPFQIISGFRSPKTNAMLHSKSTGVADNSLHVKGMAVDVRLNDRSIEALRDAGLSLKRGGVGYYPASKFVHLDVGRVRRW